MPSQGAPQPSEGREIQLDGLLPRPCSKFWKVSTLRPSILANSPGLSFPPAPNDRELN